MANAYLENTAVTELKPEYTVLALKDKFAKTKEEQKQIYDGAKEILENIDQNNTELRENKDGSYDFAEKDLTTERETEKKLQQDAVAKGADIKRESEMLEKYGDSFARLYQIKDSEEKSGANTKLEFTEVTERQLVGTTKQEDYFNFLAAGGQITRAALSVDLGGGAKFSISMIPYDKPGNDKPELKAQLSFADETLNKLNAEKMSRIMEFCETHGMPTFQMDIPYSFDGNVDFNEKMASLLRQVKENERIKAQAANKREYEETEAQRVQQNGEKEQLQAEGRDVSEIPSPDKPSFALAASKDIQDTVSAEQSVAAANPQVQQSPAQTPQKTAPKKEKDIKDAEKLMEKFLEGGLRKTRDRSYFKTHTGWFGRGWTEYIIYDRENPNNRENDCKCDKNGDVKYTYSCKLFIKKDDNGFHFGYRAPDNKKIDEGIVGGLAGQLKDLGITHVSFPDGLSDAEKKIWRIALAEKGIVPIEMGLDRAKAEGMLKAAKEKLSTEEYKKFRYRLAVQMEKDNIHKGKVVLPSEQDFIEGLKFSQKYLAFTDGYNGRLKSMLRDKLDAADINKYDGALDKIALYKSMRRLFDVYKENADNASLLNSGILNSAEKNKLHAAGLTGPVSEFNENQMAELFEIMLPAGREEAYKELDEALLAAKDTANRTSKGAKRADNVIIKEVFDGARNRFEKVNEILSSMGIEEMTFPKAFGRLYYEDRFYDEHPQFLKKTQQNQTPKPQPAVKNAEQTAAPKTQENSANFAAVAAANKKQYQ